MNPRIKKLLSYYKPYLGLLAADLACAIVAAGIALVIPLCARHITKSILSGAAPNALEQIYWVGLAMLGLAIAQLLCNMFISYRGHMMGAYMERDIRAELFDHYQKLPFGFYDNQKVGQLMTRLSNDTFSIGELCHHGPEDIVITFIKFFGAFAILMNINPQLTLIVFAFLPLMAAYAFYFNTKMKKAMRVSRERISEINAQAEDTLSGIKVVYSFANEDTEKEKFAYANNRFLESRKNIYKNETYFHDGVGMFTQLFTIAIITFGGARILGASLDLADLVTYLLYLGLLIEPIRTALNFARLYNEGITGFDRIMDAVETKPHIQDTENSIELAEANGSIAFRNVSFSYKGNHSYVFDDLSIDIAAGEFVALVGPSGIGKTTLCSLIPRFYEIDKGSIQIDGRDIREVSLQSLRENIGMVQQDVYLFAGTVIENIRYGKPGSSKAEIIEAAKKANAHEFIMELPDGYETDIGQRGVKLSGGQKQRLSIARVFLKDPPIIIFDEATSALDNESERAVQDSMEKLTNNRTTLVIAHRLSTVRNAQRIIVLNKDGIAEQGTHEALIAQGGAYAKLYNTQLSI